MPKVLDVSEFPRERSYECEDGSLVNVKEVLELHYEAIMGLLEANLVRAHDSFGFAMAAPQFGRMTELNEQWDNPQDFVWFVGGWGPNQDRYIANAIRKMRPLLRLDEFEMQHPSTLDIRLIDRDHFKNEVQSADENGDFPWGDFPHGGAAVVQMGHLLLVGGVSALSQIEDDTVVRMILGSIGQKIVLGNSMLQT